MTLYQAMCSQNINLILTDIRIVRYLLCLYLLWMHCHVNYVCEPFRTRQIVPGMVISRKRPSHHWSFIRHQAFIWTNDELFLITPLEKKLMESEYTIISLQGNVFENVVGNFVSVLSLGFLLMQIDFRPGGRRMSRFEGRSLPGPQQLQLLSDLCRHGHRVWAGLPPTVWVWTLLQSSK